MTSKIVPKSLHTVSVLVVMARTIYKASAFQTTIGTVYSVSITGAVHQALEALGYTVDADFYGLADQAIKKLNKEF
jgi:hypothetical protein